MTSRLLALPADKQMRSVIVLRDIDPRILAMLGVRFVLTDREYDGPVSVRAIEPIKEKFLFLYEIARPNLGDYSPVVVSKIATAPEIIARLANPSLDPTHEVIADVPSDINRLVPGATLCAHFQRQSPTAGRERRPLDPASSSGIQPLPRSDRARRRKTNFGSGELSGNRYSVFRQVRHQIVAPDGAVP